MNDSFPYNIACNTLLGWGPRPLSIPALKACPAFRTLGMGTDNRFLNGSKETLQSQALCPSHSETWLCPAEAGLIREASPSAGCASGYK